MLRNGITKPKDKCKCKKVKEKLLKIWQINNLYVIIDVQSINRLIIYLLIYIKMSTKSIILAVIINTAVIVFLGVICYQSLLLNLTQNVL